MFSESDIDYLQARQQDLRQGGHARPIGPAWLRRSGLHRARDDCFDFYGTWCALSRVVCPGSPNRNRSLVASEGLEGLAAAPVVRPREYEEAK